jgi:hypothetical protein
MKFPVFSLLAGNFGFRDGFARDCLLQRRVFANLTRSIRSPKILPSELRAASVIRVYVARAVSWRGPGGEVRRLTDDRLVLRRAFADQIADDHQPGGDPDARLGA